MHEAAARRRPAPRRLPHRHRPDHGREPGRASTRRRPTARSSTRCRDPIHADRRHRRAHAARWRPRARWSRWPASTSTASRAPARVFDGEDAAMEAILAGRIKPGDVVVIRYEGPKGGPGMREMLAVTGAMKGAGRGGDARPDHRRPVLRRHPRLLHRPRRPRGGRRRPDRLRGRRRPHRDRRPRPHHRPAGRRGDARGRRADWKLPSPRYTTGVLAKYARLAHGAEVGAVTSAGFEDD